MVYTAEQDPGTTVLINKLNPRNQNDLDGAELALFLIRADETPPAGRFNYPHYMALHHHLFQDVYDWAGTARTIRIGKGSNWFRYPEHIDPQMKAAFATLEGHTLLADKRPAEFGTLAAEALAWPNAIHPFREGNGRTQLTLLSMLSEQAGLPFNDDQLARDRVIAAMIDSFGGDEDPLRKLILDLVSA